MKNTCGMIGFMVVALITFRLVYGAWPPMEGKMGEWLASNPRAVWAMVAGVVGGMVGALVARTFAKD